MRTISCFVLTLVLLLGVSAMTPLVAQVDIHVIMPGEENPTGGTYCFADDDTKKVNALWHIVGPQWREALAHPENDLIRDPKRESLRGSVVYYHTNQHECFFVPPGMKARVPIFAEPAKSSAKEDDKKTTINAEEISRGATSTFIGWVLSISILAALILVGYTAWRETRKKSSEAMREQREWERTHPEVSGPPMVEGGLEGVRPEHQIDTARNTLQTVAARSFVPNSKPRDYRVIGDVVRGLLNGTGNVDYNGIDPQEREFRNTLGFRGLVEHIATGQRLYRYALSMCCNGVYSGLIGEGETFTFTPLVDQNGLEVRIAPVISATTEEIGRYGESEYDPRHDMVGVAVLREEPVSHILSNLPRRSRVFMSGNGR